MEEKKDPETGDVHVRIDPSPEITADNLISASEYGFHKGYMKAVRDMAICMFAVFIVLGALYPTWSKE